MKLLIVLTLIAFGYTEKLDRGYLPPSNAATAGGSPGALTAPGRQGSTLGETVQIGFGSPTSGRQPGSFDVASGSPQNGLGYGSPTVGPITTGVSAGSPSIGNGNLFDIANSPSGPSQGPFDQQTYSTQTSAPTIQEFGQGQGYTEQAYKPERAQAAADRSAEILKNINENNGDTYSYSYETSNGISAEESGTATDGVRAQGGFSFTGDDGKAYSVTYTADENGFQPQGEHLPTPPPIPDEILKSLQDNARAAAAGTQEGAYRPDEYESEGSPQQYNAGSSIQPQGPTQGYALQGPSITQAESTKFSVGQGDLQGQERPGQGSSQFATSLTGSQTPGSQSQQTFRPNGRGFNGQNEIAQGQGRGPAYNYAQPDNRFPVNQGAGLNLANGQLGSAGQANQARPGQGSDQFSDGLAGSPATQSNQLAVRPNVQGANGLSQIGERPGSGYQYAQPQNSFGSATNQGQVTPAFGSGNIQGSGSGNRPSFGTPQDSQQSTSQLQEYASKLANKPASSFNNFGQGQINPASPQGSQVRPGNQGSSGAPGSSGQGYQYQPNSLSDVNARPTGISQPGQGSRYNLNAAQPFNGLNNNFQQGSPQFGNTGSSIGVSQYKQNIESDQSPFASGTQTSSSRAPNGQLDSPSFGTTAGPSQNGTPFGTGNKPFGSSSPGSASTQFKTSGPIQAPYQYDRPSQSFPPQSQGTNGARPGSISGGFQGGNGQSPSLTSSGSQSPNGQGSGSPGLLGTTAQGPSSSSQGYQSSNGQRPGAGSQGSPSGNGRLPGGSSPGYGNGGIGGLSGYQYGNGQLPSSTSSGPQTTNGQGAGFPGLQGAQSSGPSSPGYQGFNGQRPGVGSQGTPSGNGKLPGGSSSGYGLTGQGVNDSRPGLSSPGFSQGVNGPDFAAPSSQGSQGTQGSQGNQGRPEQFGGPRQPPSFSPQEGYKY